MSMMDVVRRITMPPAPDMPPADRFMHAVFREGDLWEFVEVLENTRVEPKVVTCIVIRGRNSQRVLPFFLFDDEDLQQLRELTRLERRRKRVVA